MDFSKRGFMEKGLNGCCSPRVENSVEFKVLEISTLCESILQEVEIGTEAYELVLSILDLCHEFHESNK